MEYDVTIDRDKYIGGSDIPIIMGISKFRTRWELLLEKAGLQESEFAGNKYTEYGHIIEPKIRAYINEKYNTNYEPNRVINGVIRYHSDGFNDESVLEVKSTSEIHKTVDEYVTYLVQLLKGMEQNKVEKGLLAVYERPEDLDEEFDEERLHEYEVDLKNYTALLDKVNAEIDRFLKDLERLKQNPLLTEEDFQPTELVALSNKVIALENRMAEYKAIEQECKAVKQELLEAMLKYDIKSWETFNGTKITRVDGTEATAKMVTEFDLDKFKEENPELHGLYLKEVIKKTSGRSGYVKITLPKA